MAEFQNLPSRIQNTAQSQLTSNEHIKLCMLGRSELLSPDFVFVTSHRVLVLDERRMGSLEVSYVNIRCNLPFIDIKQVELTRQLKHWMFGQACLELEMGRNRYLINNLSYREAKRALEFICSQLVPGRKV